VSELKYKHWFEHRNGRIVFDNPGMYRTNLALVKGKRGFILIYEESEDHPVSAGSRAYYFHVLIKALNKHSDFYAMSPLDIHHEIMKLFCSYMVEKPGGEWVEYTPSLTELSAKEWACYVEKVEYYAGTKGIVINEITAFIK
jgi:hypothetical protein